MGRQILEGTEKLYEAYVRFDEWDWTTPIHVTGSNVSVTLYVGINL